MSGRRVYPRFREAAPWIGQMRLSQDVSVQVGEAANELTVLSDAPGVLDEKLTLALVSSAGEMELQVKVIDSRPHVVDGVVRHRVRLEMTSPDGQSMTPLGNEPSGQSDCGDSEA